LFPETVTLLPISTPSEDGRGKILAPELRGFYNGESGAGVNGSAFSTSTRRGGRAMSESKYKNRRGLRKGATRRKNGTDPIVACTEADCENPEIIGKCLVFSGVKNDNGYGFVSVCGKMVRVHRYVWEKANGKIPEGMVVDHLCRNRACCNIAHLRIVTSRQNTLENSKGLAAVNAAKTHCPQGHEYSKENTYLLGRHRICRICKRERRL
jgi:hypothetical protein